MVHSAVGEMQIHGYWKRQRLLLGLGAHSSSSLPVEIGMSSHNVRREKRPAPGGLLYVYDIYWYIALRGLRPVQAYYLDAVGIAASLGNDDGRNSAHTKKGSGRTYEAAETMPNASCYV